MHNTATKKQAIDLIQSLRAAGWERQVEPNTLFPVGHRLHDRPFAVLVTLSIHRRKGMLFDDGLIFVNFKLVGSGWRRRWVAHIRTIPDYTKPSDGLRSARYELDRFIQLDAKHYNPQPSNT